MYNIGIQIKSGPKQGLETYIEAFEIEVFASAEMKQSTKSVCHALSICNCFSGEGSGKGLIQTLS